MFDLNLEHKEHVKKMNSVTLILSAACAAKICPNFYIEVTDL